MRIIKSFFIAFSMYSKIPMPQFEWKDEDMRYALCFFPWVGAVIGVLWYLWKWICARFGVGTLCYTVVGTAIPILITGGFHVDGFLDTCDALHSYQPRERKLEILKDSHIGAFAVIMLTLYGLIFLGGFSEITECRTLVVAGAGSFLSRVLSGVAVVSFPSAKQEGTLYLFADKAHKKSGKNCFVRTGNPVHRLYDVDIFRDGRNRGGSGPAYFCVLLLSQQKRVRRHHRRYGGVFCDVLRRMRGGCGSNRRTYDADSVKCIAG